MKLKPYQLCRLCDGAVHGRLPRMLRLWLYPAANVLLLAAAMLLGLIWLMLPVLLGWNALLALYLLHRHHAFGTIYQRKPRPRDALCETVLIDASLIGQGTRLRAASQPIDVSDCLTLRLGSGALLLGAAMVHTADTLPRADRAAVLSAVQGLNLKPSRMRSHSPVLRREEEEGLTIVTVKDGVDERRFFLGEYWPLTRQCWSIWEGNPREMTDHDRLRIADTASYMAQGNCRVLAYATSAGNEMPVFLGLCGVGEEVHVTAVQEVASLRGMGLTVMLDPGTQPDTDLDSLRNLLELEDYHARADIHLSPRIVQSSALGIIRRSGDSLLEPVSELRRNFRTIEATLQRFALLTGIPLVLTLLFGCWPGALLATGLCLYAAIALGVDLNTPAPRWQTLLGIALTALLTKAFLLTQGAALFGMGGCVITAGCAAVCAVRLSGPAFTMKGDGWKRSLPLPLCAGGFMLGAVLIALSAGTAMVLPAVFSALMAAVIALLIRLEPMIFR